MERHKQYFALKHFHNVKPKNFLNPLLQTFITKIVLIIHYGIAKIPKFSPLYSTYPCMCLFRDLQYKAKVYATMVVPLNPSKSRMLRGLHASFCMLTTRWGVHC